jgi:hypothetical protein
LGQQAEVIQNDENDDDWDIGKSEEVLQRKYKKLKIGGQSNVRPFK